MIPLLSTCKTPCHLPVTLRRGTLCGKHFHDIEAASLAFCMRCSPNVWLTTLQKRMRSCVLHGLCWRSSPPVWFLHPLPSPAISMPPYTPEITALQAFLQASVVQTVLCAPSSTLSTLAYLSVAILIIDRLSSYLSLHIICLLLCLFSLAVSPSFLPCSKWLLHCQSQFIF